MCKINDLVVLIADSDEKSLEEMCDIIKTVGIERILCASSGAEALELVLKNENQVDMVLTESNLKDMSGTILVGKLKQLEKNLLIMIYSACIEYDAHMVALTVGSIDYLNKRSPEYQETFRKKITHWAEVARLQAVVDGR